jgi:hypothetical protein
MQALCVTNGVAEAIKCFETLTAYFIGSFLSVSTSRSSISSSSNFIWAGFVDIFVNIHNNNYGN